VKAMLWISSLAAVVALGFVLTSPPAEAHHSSTPFYDDTQDVEVIGTVSRFNFRNPHSFIYIEAENEDGQMVEWEVELGAAVSMSRSGWTRETIQTGDPIRAVGNPSRAAGTFGMCCASLTQPDGSEIQLVRFESDEVPLQLVAFVASLAGGS
jgi:hypothetical protein